MRFHYVMEWGWQIKRLDAGNIEKSNLVLHACPSAYVAGWKKDSHLQSNFQRKTAPVPRLFSTPQKRAVFPAVFPEQRERQRGAIRCKFSPGFAANKRRKVVVPNRLPNDCDRFPIPSPTAEYDFDGAAVPKGHELPEHNVPDRGQAESRFVQQPVPVQLLFAKSVLSGLRARFRNSD